MNKTSHNSDMKDKLLSLFTQLFRYGTVGLSGFALEYTIFLLITFFSKAETVGIFSARVATISFAHTTGFLCGAVWTFLLNKFWSFRARANTFSQSVKYICLLIVNIFITNYLLLAITEAFPISPELAKLFIMAAVACWNFLIFKYYIYKVK